MTRALPLVLVAALLLAAPALGHQGRVSQLRVQPVANGGFENGLAGWTAVGEAAPCPWTAIVAGTTSFVCHAGYGFAEPAPVDGDVFASADFDRSTAAAPAEAMLSERVSIPARGRATLHWSDFLSWDLVTYGASKPRVVSVQIRSADGTRVLGTLYRRQIDPGTTDFGTAGWQAHAADVSRFAGRNVTLAFVLSMPEVKSGPATYSLDAVGIDSHSA